MTWTKERIEAVEALLAAATPGPWFVVEDERPGMEWNRHICWDEHGDHRVAFMASDAGTEANAALIALSPALAARVIELEAALRACVQAHETGRFEPAQAAYENARAALETPNAD